MNFFNNIRFAALVVLTFMALTVMPTEMSAKKNDGKAKVEKVDSKKKAAKGKKGKKGKKGETETADTLKKKETKYEKLFKKPHKVAQGMMTLHMKDGKVYFEMPLSLMGREMVVGSTIKSISDNGNGVIGSKPMSLKHIRFEKSDSTVQLCAIDATYMSSDPDIRKAIAKSSSGSIIKNMKIAAWSPDSTAVVFDMTSFFLEHDKTMSPFSEVAAYASYERNENFKKELSFLTDVKAFEDNVSVTSSMSYTYTMKDQRGRTIYKDEPFTAELTRTLLLLPEQPYHPRMADYRIGVFFTQRQEFGNRLSNSNSVFFANRWRLEPSDTAAYRAGELVKPVKPIVFYIDENFPQWWRPFIKEGVEQWQELFEQIGFKDAILALDYPKDDPSFDPDNIKYSCVRYAPIGIQNAMGPSWVDPRSGEIITASVYVYHDIVKLIQRWMFIQTSQADTDVRALEFPQHVLGDAIRYVIAHEIGHCLGFMHNMSASSVIPVESLRDPEFTQTHGTTTSIMDYARFNYVAQPGDKERGVKLTPPRFGSYDKWLIEWTYKPVFDAASFQEEAEITSSWITEAVAKNPIYRYGKQQFYSALYDPRSQSEDLGDDAVDATKYGVANLKYIMANYLDWFNEGDEDFEFRTAIYNGMLNQYLAYAQHVVLNVGGLYKNEIKAADKLKRFENIPEAKQRRALEYMFTLHDDVSWLGDKAVLDRLPIVGSPEFAVCNAIQGLILMTPGLASSSDGVSTREFSAQDCFEVILNKVFGTPAGKPLTKIQRAFQSQLVYNYMSMGNFKIPGSKDAFAFAEGAQSLTAQYYGSSDESPLYGELMYGPVSGYEWFPRNMFNQGELTVADLYAVLKKARAMMVARRASANAQDKAHYDLLISTIDYSVK